MRNMNNLQYCSNKIVLKCKKNVNPSRPWVLINLSKWHIMSMAGNIIEPLRLISYGDKGSFLLRMNNKCINAEFMINIQF